MNCGSLNVLPHAALTSAGVLPTGRNQPLVIGCVNPGVSGEQLERHVRSIRTFAGECGWRWVYTVHVGMERDSVAQVRAIAETVRADGVIVPDIRAIDRRMPELVEFTSVVTMQPPKIYPFVHGTVSIDPWRPLVVGMPA